MIGLELSPDNKFAAAYTNNNQTILLNTLISEFTIIQNFLSSTQTIQVKKFSLIQINMALNSGNVSFGYEPCHLWATYLGSV